LGKLYFSYTDFFLVPLYLFFVFLIATRTKKKYIKKKPEYRFFIKGIIAKLIGVSLFLMFYTLYYETGDTISYYKGAKSLSNLLFSDFKKGMSILFNTESPYNSYNSFTEETGRPPFYIFRDTMTFNVSRFSVIFYVLGAGSLIITNFLCAIFSFIGVWKLYVLFNSIFKGISKELAFIILFMPSTLFWGSGIMKDSFVLGSLCWLTANFYMGVIVRNKIIKNTVLMIFNFLIIVNLKPYVAVGVIPGMLLWINASFITSFKSSFVKFFLRPLVMVFIVFSGLFVVNNLSTFGLEEYENVDQTLGQAQVIQQDLLRSEQYGSNNYNIGTIDGSISGMLKVAPLAIFTAIYRPLIFEVGSPAMLISAIENSVLILLTFLALIRTNPLHTYRLISKNPFLLYCVIFTLIFAFGVGIASTNFGALVRYRIPLIPFYFSVILIMRKINKIKIN
tara:strand:+ start:3090 stop:4436 length:1347 start_codon:yes stop_codon:yes gene_type:complete